MSFQSEICRFGQFALFRQNRERISSTIKFGVGDRRPTADPLTKSPYTKMVSNLTKVRKPSCLRGLPASELTSVLHLALDVIALSTASARRGLSWVRPGRCCELEMLRAVYARATRGRCACSGASTQPWREIHATPTSLYRTAA